MKHFQKARRDAEIAAYLYRLNKRIGQVQQLVRVSYMLEKYFLRGQKHVMHL